MEKKWLIGMIIFIVIAMSVAAVTYFYLTSRASRTTDTPALPNSLPDELSVNFDPTVNRPVFRIKAENIATRTLDLEMIFPEAYMAGEITSLITCQNIDLEEMFAGIKEHLNESTILSGLCSDKTCKEINRKCVWRSN